MATTIPKDAMEFAESERAFLEAHLPPKDGSAPRSHQPFTTLTFATSLDSSLALSPGVPTAISGPQSKAMTHYLRSRHDGILIGVGTAIADDPSLNCRIAGVGGYGGEGLHGQPRGIVIDPSARWEFTEDSKLFKLCREGRGRPPWISENGHNCINWQELLAKLKEKGLRSVMVEGGGHIINSLLLPEHQSNIDMVIVTIAPTWLGQGGVVVSPNRCFNENQKRIPAARLSNAK
ncbi:2,5-diamino-6-ribosylamino-4(3H)-pyrimidinone 5 -phosphate reductase [Cordyceps militaris]|uniref:2,5-diamino-6-ribosylamino-4(3H)-pyrimidinone 5'-phosphate reductase n=1 Tax=Cordyceps militaris TaxID=73501 RepID=A0A2H4SV57_CORMI|nr:2,5-diamino-6-ribosylamino-4(3H)-pyrimidinone 5 -phosphate reductase [Cordyceps militaris]